MLKSWYLYFMQHYVFLWICLWRFFHRNRLRIEAHLCMMSANIYYIPKNIPNFIHCKFVDDFSTYIRSRSFRDDTVSSFPSCRWIVKTWKGVSSMRRQREPRATEVVMFGFRIACYEIWKCTHLKISFLKSNELHHLYIR